MLAQAAKTPEATAIIPGTERLTYSELLIQARQVERALRSHGIGREHLVAICLERSASIVSAILGTLFSGAAYVPLDPAYPQERLRVIAVHANVKAINSQRKL